MRRIWSLFLLPMIDALETGEGRRDDAATDAARQEPPQRPAPDAPGCAPGSARSDISL